MSDTINEGGFAPKRHAVNASDRHRAVQDVTSDDLDAAIRELSDRERIAALTQIAELTPQTVRLAIDLQHSLRPPPQPVAGTPEFDEETARIRASGRHRQADARDGFARRAREAQPHAETPGGS